MLGAALVAAFAGEISGLFQGSGQELFDAAILIFAVVMLTWHNVWMAGHGRALAREMKQVGAQVSAGERPMAALAIVVGIAVLREGSEVVALPPWRRQSGRRLVGSNARRRGAGRAGGVLPIAASDVFSGCWRSSAHRLFGVTAGLVTLLAAGMAVAQSILFLQQGGYLEFFTSRVWDTSWILKQDSIVGRLLHTLIGYNDMPNGAQLLAYLATVAVVVALTRFERARHPRPNHWQSGPPTWRGYHKFSERRT